MTGALPSPEYNERLMNRFALPLTLFGIASLLYATSEEIRGFLVNRVDESKRAVGIVVGVIDSSGRDVIPYGKLAKDSPEQVNGDTIFEIASTTKVFTSLLLADMVERGEVKLDTPVADLLPAKVKVPERGGKKITLLDLSMHLSGLPRMPLNMHPKDLGNIYADYTPAKLYEFLAAYPLPRDIGSKYEYSNLGGGLLGFALAHKAGMSYEQLVRKRILEPLGMNDSGITLSAEQKKRMASGYDPGLEPAKNWEFDALAGCCALHSTANDMLKFVAANLELSDTPLKAAMRKMRSIRHETGTPDFDIMMAWQLYKRYDSEIVWHNGSSAGYWSFVGFDPEKKRGAVVLCNTYLDIDDIGLHYIEKQWPVKTLEAPKQHTQVTLDPKVLTSYVGEYRVNPNFSFKVTLENGHLFAQTPTQPRFELFAEEEGVFFLKIADAEVTFTKEKDGRAVMYLLQNAKTIRGVKVP
jgi:D-alanyl-D-alanine-carboxypeptidase/D-alanyl-D-alanine-endopeptidase